MKGLVATLNLLMIIYTYFDCSKGFIFSGRKVCYDGVGCFSNSAPFDNALGSLPESPKDVKITFTLFNRRDSRHGGVLACNDTESIQNAGFDPAKPTKFIIHGYMGLAASTWVYNMTRGFLFREDCQVIAVDWSKGASKIYEQSAANTRVVGAVTAQLLATLRDKMGVNMTTIHIVGHSLGAQTAGYIGTRIPNLGRITGLDPAGPLFEKYAPEVRLDPSDAIFVDVIHSDAEPLTKAGFGTRSPCGHVDFYPNGGGSQPGCPQPVRATMVELLTLHFTEAFDDVACSHQRSYYYFIESLLETNCNFVAHPCQSYTDFLNGACRMCGTRPCPVMGYMALKTTQRGSYYLKTNDHNPFCVSSN